jgi:hypothetical protein
MLSHVAKIDFFGKKWSTEKAWWEKYHIVTNHTIVIEAIVSYRKT